MTGASPYPGLRPFREEESHLFFGREGQTDELLRRLQRRRFLSVLGTSGSGKSSLVYAGLVPALRGDYMVGIRSRWHIVTVRPGGDPLGRFAQNLASIKALDGCIRDDLRQSSLALAKALERSMSAGRWDADSNLLIIADQFEELFRHADEVRDSGWDERSTFVKLLIEAARVPDLPLYVVMTMRSEYLGDCAQFRDLPETINEGQYLIPRLTREHWRAAIEGPAQLMGAKISSVLTQRLLNDVARLEESGSGKALGGGDDADALPLLQHSLHRTWVRFAAAAAEEPDARRREVSIREYEAVGGIDDSLSRHLDQALDHARDRVGSDADRIARRIFQRLRVRDAKGREARDPLPFGELCTVIGAAPTHIADVIDCFRKDGRNFLTPSAPAPFETSTEIDIAHECLLRRWKRLQTDWIPEEDESRRIYLRMVQVIDDNELVSGPRLQIAKEWWDKRQPTAAWAARYDRRFTDVAQLLERSLKAKADLEREGREKAERDERRKRLVRILGLSMAAVAALAIYAASIGLTQYRGSQTARHNWHLAFAQLLAAKAQLASSETVAPRQTGALLAAASVRYSEALSEPPPIESRAVLATALPWIPRVLPDIRTDAPVSLFARSEDGTLLAMASGDGSVVIVRGDATQQRLATLANPIGMTFSRDGRHLVVTGSDEERAAEIWDLQTSARVAAIGCPNIPTGPAVLSPDNGVLLVPCVSLLRWDEPAWRAGRTGSPVEWTDGLAPATALAFDATGEHVAVGGEDARGAEDRILIYNLRLGRLLRTLSIGTVADVASVVFLPGLARLGVIDKAGTVRIWVLDHDGDQPILLLHSRPLVDMRPSADGRSIVTVAEDGIVRLWDSAGRQQWQVSVGRELTTGRFEWGSRLLVAATGGTQVSRWTVWDEAQRQPLSLVGGSYALGAKFAADRVFSLGGRELRMLDEQGNLHKVPLDASPITLAVTEDARHVAVVARNGGLSRITGLLDLELVMLRQAAPDRLEVAWRQALPGTERGSRGSPRAAVRFSPDGRLVVAMSGAVLSSAPATFTMYDVETGTVKGTFNQRGVRALVQLSSEGTILAAADKGAIVAWNPAENRRRAVVGSSSEGNLTVATAFSHDGSFLAIAEPGQGADSSLESTMIRLRRWPDLAEMRSWPYDGTVSRLAFSHDNRRLVSAGADGAMRVWDSQTGDELSRIHTTEPPLTLAFSTDDRRLVAVGRTTVWRYWWDVKDLMAELCRVTDRNLSEREWDSYVPKDFRETGRSFRCVCQERPCVSAAPAKDSGSH